MERRFYEAAAEGNGTSLLDFAEDDPLILDRCVVGSYKETTLHTVVMPRHEKYIDERRSSFSLSLLAQ